MDRCGLRKREQTHSRLCQKRFALGKGYSRFAPSIFPAKASLRSPLATALYRTNHGMQVRAHPIYTTHIHRERCAENRRVCHTLDSWVGRTPVQSNEPNIGSTLDPTFIDIRVCTCPSVKDAELPTGCAGLHIETEPACTSDSRSESLYAASAFAQR